MLLTSRVYGDHVCSNEEAEQNTCDVMASVAGSRFVTRARVRYPPKMAPNTRRIDRKSVV